MQERVWNTTSPRWTNEKGMVRRRNIVFVAKQQIISQMICCFAFYAQPHTDEICRYRKFYHQ